MNDYQNHGGSRHGLHAACNSLRTIARRVCDAFHGERTVENIAIIAIITAVIVTAVIAYHRVPILAGWPV